MPIGFYFTDMAKLHSLIALQQFMRGLGEDMDEAELVRVGFVPLKLPIFPSYKNNNYKFLSSFHEQSSFKCVLCQLEPTMYNVFCLRHDHTTRSLRQTGFT